MTPANLREVASKIYAIDNPPMAHVVADVSAVTGVSVKDLCGFSRTRPIARARQLAMWRLRQDGIPYSAIGKFLGGRDHTTVIHGINKINQLMEQAND